MKYHVLRRAAAFVMALALLAACSSRRAASNGANASVSQESTGLQILRDSLQAIASSCGAQVGIALITYSKDTLTVNNSEGYPLMSMFKLHEAIAVCRTLNQSGGSLDSLLTIDSSELSTETWSPMLKEYSPEGFTVSIRRLMEYLLISSDNNASNILFERIADVAATDSIAGTVLPRRGFSLVWKESEMAADHSRAYDNVSSPLAYASLIDKVFTTDVVSPSDTKFIREMMRRCDTGMERIAAGLPADRGIQFAHRTGSGYTNGRGQVSAVNDGGYVTLPDGRSYSIAVMVKGYPGPQEDADRLIARISAAVCRFFLKEKQ